MVNEKQYHQSWVKKLLVKLKHKPEIKKPEGIHGLILFKVNSKEAKAHV